MAEGMTAVAEYMASLIPKASEADLELIKLLCLPNKIISLSLGVSPKAISMHITRLGVKFEVENRRAIIVKALEFGLVTVDQLVYRRFNGTANLSGATN